MIGGVEGVWRGVLGGVRGVWRGVDGVFWRVWRGGKTLNPTVKQ